MITAFFAPKTKRKRGRPAADADDDSSKKRPASASSSTVSSSPSTSSAPSTISPTNSATSGAKSSEQASSCSLLAHFPSSDEAISWRAALRKQLESKSFESLARFVAKERAGKTVYPPPELVFSALKRTPLHKVKVVIVGQDPYHQPSQGHGLSFSVPPRIAVPPSLRNIYKELMNDPAVERFDAKPTHGNLSRWASQGVLLLNNVLTVWWGEAGSHSKRGWEEFTDAVIKAVIERDNNDNETEEESEDDGGKGVVFLLWGKPASKKAQTVLAKYGRGGKHAIIMTSHPSPLGATKTSSPFLGSKCFSRANEELESRGWKPVDWRVS